MGLRTIALAYRLIGAQSMFSTREYLEKQMIFLGFAVFENLIKPESVPVLRKLKAAAIDCKIVTGDNLLTSFYVAETCCLLDKKIKLIEDD